MTNKSDIKKLAEQMANSMNSLDDIKDFQKQLMQLFRMDVNKTGHLNERNQCSRPAYNSL